MKTLYEEIDERARVLAQDNARLLVDQTIGLELIKAAMNIGASIIVERGVDAITPIEVEAALLEHVFKEQRAYGSGDSTPYPQG